MAEQKYDAIVVGAGFGGIYHLIRLRQLGLRCKLFEAGSDFGGSWYWNRYPGARVDTHIPVYEFSFPELWKEWTWTEKFPGWQELQAYFTYVDLKLDLRKDCQFNSTIEAAHWDDRSHVWHVSSRGKDGARRAAARYLILCLGFASKPYVPQFKGLETFQGTWAHTARWPMEGIETDRKKVGIIGTGASGVQVVEEVGKHVDHLTVFQRTPNIAIPMGQCTISKEVQDHFKQAYEGIYAKLPTTSSGLVFDAIQRSMMQDSEEEREATLQTLWSRGGFHFIRGNYRDIFLNEDSNNAVYAFWRKKVSERVKDPKKCELLAPTVAPHPFGSKRASLERHYYEILDQDNVDIVDTNMNPIVEITPKGVKTAEKEYELDVLVLATGFDTHTGSILDIDLRGLNGRSIQDHWQKSTTTYLGMTVDNFPNLFFVSGPQAPTAFSNGPVCIEMQGGWIIQTIDYLRQHGITKFSPTSHAALAYKKHISASSELTLLSKTKSWYNGDNIPGKNREAYNYVGGVSNYKQEITNELERGYPGFEREALVTSRL